MFRKLSVPELLLLIGGAGIVIVLTTIYGVPFRLDDVLHMDWARDVTFWDAFHPVKGEIVRSYRPLFAATIWILTHTAGTDHYFPWHLTLVLSYMIGLGYVGVTARYLAKRSSALFLSTGLYWLAFLPILNVLFWFGDLTFSIELMFVGPAWYYTLRGLFEGRAKYVLLGCLLSSAAVFSKEPAIVLTLGVYTLTILFNFYELRTTWKRYPHSDKLTVVFAFLVLLSASLFIYFVSPTRSNRFFHFERLTNSEISFFIWDRFRYYSENLLTPPGRLILAFPLCYIVVNAYHTIKGIPRSRSATIIFTLMSAVLCFFGVTSIIEYSALLVVVPIILYLSGQQIGLRLLPFSVTALIFFGVLLITIMLVKTQLVELSFVLILLSSVTFSFVLADIQKNLRFSELSITAKRLVLGTLIIGVIGVIIWFLPTVLKRESMLREARDTRLNANDAIQWMAAHLPQRSTVLVTSHSLYGIAHADDLTSQDDEVKVYRQYTFIMGYVRFYFKQLGRTDIRLGYLEDSTMVQSVLDAFRETPSSYLFLQTGYDVDRFHSGINNTVPLHLSDTLLAAFRRGSYPSEIWKLHR
jgi:hypothetical protein